MSRVYWNTHDDQVELRGWERAHLAWLAHGPAAVAWDLDQPFTHERVGELLDLVPPVARDHHYERLAACRALDALNVSHGSDVGGAAEAALAWRELVHDVRVRLDVDGYDLEVAGVALNTRDVSFNTAAVAGSRPIQLAAKLHGYCEVHAYVEGPDRAWLADVIEEGLRAGLYREKPIRKTETDDAARDVDAGWRDVQRLLRETDDDPVVTAYSVTDDFPSPTVADWTPLGDDGDPENTWDRWYALADDRRWNLGVAGVRRRPWLRLAPETLGVPTFHHPVTVYDLHSWDRDKRVQRATRGGSRRRERDRDR